VTEYAWDDHARLNADVAELMARYEHRISQYRKLAGNGVRKPIQGGCGQVRVNSDGEVLSIELDLANARAAGEQRLAAWVLDAIRGAHTQAERVSQLIAEQ